jgi:hypothetical protein
MWERPKEIGHAVQKEINRTGTVNVPLRGIISYVANAPHPDPLPLGEGV